MINGERHSAEVEARLLLVQFIRDVAGLKGTNIGCDTTSCGACTVLLDGKTVKSCTILAAQADGCEVKTIEGMASPDGEMHPIQRAFQENHGLQCGYCTPGMVMAIAGLIDEAGEGEMTDESVRLGLEGNLCRCTGYHNIVKSALAAGRAAGVVA
ncbi:MAG: (2Fe-2S)-binding protein [Acidimicrobiales bacterium]